MKFGAAGVISSVKVDKTTNQTLMSCVIGGKIGTML